MAATGMGTWRDSCGWKVVIGKFDGPRDKIKTTAGEVRVEQRKQQGRLKYVK